MPRRQSNKSGRRLPRNRTRKQKGNRAEKPPTRQEMKTPEATALLRSPIFPISKRCMGQLYYENALGVSVPGNGNSASYFFSANGIFDPNITGTGHQPMGFDQMMLFYEQATVVRSTVTITPIPSAPMRVGICLAPDNTALTDPQRIVENGLERTLSLSGLTSASNVNQRNPSITLSCDIASYFGRKTLRELLDDDQLFTTAAANPNEQVYYAFVFWQVTPDGSTAHSCEFDVTLSYDVIYWEPRKLAPS
jgi:hypothetical protein